MGDYPSPASGSSDSARWTGLAAALPHAGRYKPVERLGKTSGRQTLLCDDVETGQRVVIKLLTFGEDFAWDDLKLFEREAETLRSLDHPAIPKYLDYFDLETQTSKGFALVQSYLEAPSMQEQLQAGRTFSEVEIQQIGQDLLNILDYLHSRQPAVIHRDIKPSNILLSDRTAHSPGKVYLVDFGSVQTLAAREGGTITVVGTYGYMPPEQFGGRAVPASDLYSLGATLIYLASGRHPADLPQDELRIAFEDFVQLSPQAIAWLRQLTEPSLGKRVASVSAAQASIQRTAQQSTAQNLGIYSSQHSILALINHDRPNTTDIVVYYDASLKVLTIKLPVRSLKIRRIDDSGFSSGTQQIFLLVVGGSVLAAVALLAMTESLAFFMCGVFFIAMLIQRILTRERYGYLKIGPQKIRIDCDERLRKSLNRQHVWKIAHATPHTLTLSIGIYELSLKGTQEELIWLEGILCHELNLIRETTH